MTGNNDSWTTFMLHFHKYVQLSLSRFLEAVLNLFRDRLRPMLKQIGVRDMQSIAGYWQKSRDSRCETGAQYDRNIPAWNDNIISQ